MDHSRFTRALAVVALMAATFVTPQLAHAGGYDTPMLYSARHQAMGGTAVSYVDDPTALFHNPAGLAGIERGELLLNLSLLLGTINGSPRPDQINIESGLVVAPFPLLGGAVRLLDMDWGGLVIGAGAFPIASASAAYRYCEGSPGVDADSSGCDDGFRYNDETTLLFIEVTPALAMNINLGDVGELRIGGAWRATYVSLSRFRGDPDVAYTDLGPGSRGDYVDFSAAGWNFTGFRAGLQALFLDKRLSFGFMYRHEVRAEIEGIAPEPIPTDTNTPAADGTPILLGYAGESVETAFRLPSRMVFGARYDHDFGPVRMGYAVDVEYAFNSQNRREDVRAVGDIFGVLGGTGENYYDVPNVFAWTDAITLRIGLEAKLLEDQLAIRLGYAYDQKTANPTFVSAFGTPPGDTHLASLGAGWDGGPWEVNFGYAFRTGSADVFPGGTISERNDRLAAAQNAEETACAFCGFVGEPSIILNGIYLDFSYEWEREVETPADDEEEEPQPEWEQTPDGEPSEEPEPTATEPTATEPTATEPTATEPTATEPTPEQQLEAEPGQDAPAAETTAADGTEEPLPAD